MPDDRNSDNDDLLDAMNASTPPSSPPPVAMALGKRTSSEAGLDYNGGGTDELESEGGNGLTDELESQAPVTNRNLASFAKRYATQKKLRGEQLTDVDNFMKVNLNLFWTSGFNHLGAIRTRWLFK
jgi:hypothetical protein